MTSKLTTAVTILTGWDRFLDLRIPQVIAQTTIINPAQRRSHRHFWIYFIMADQSDAPERRRE